MIKRVQVISTDSDEIIERHAIEVALPNESWGGEIRNSVFGKSYVNTHITIQVCTHTSFTVTQLVI